MIAQLILAASLFAGSFQPIGIWLLAPFGFALFLHLLRKQQHTFLIGFSFSFLANLIILYWSGAYVGVLPWLLLALLQGAYYLPIGFIASKTRSIPALLLSILVIDEIKARFPFGGFSWTRIAFSQVESPFVKTVAIGGVVTLSAVTLVISWMILAPQKSNFIALTLAFASTFFFIPAESSTQTINVRAIQGGVSAPGLEFNARAFEVVKNHIRESEKAISPGDELVIWPENAIDIDPLKNTLAKKLVTDYIKKSDLPLIAGAVVEREGLKNVAIAFNSQGEVETIYEKRYLTPFGEFMPLRKVAEFISPYAEQVTDFIPGESEITHIVGGKNLASIICYEIINDGIVRSASKNSAALIVHTNSATFFGTAEGAQQLAITRLRAIEHARFIVSVSTVGPSAIIDTKGEVLSQLAEGERGSIGYPIALTSQETISDKLGGLSTIFIISLFIALTVLDRRRLQ